jgi:hypothetical protein
MAAASHITPPPRATSNKIVLCLRNPPIFPFPAAPPRPNSGNTKAVSWLLRQLTRHHSAAVRKYLATHKDKLPAIAIRETTAKIKYGVKSPQKQKS